MVDVAASTKDCSANLLGAISRIHKLIPDGKIFLFEESLKPNWRVLNSMKNELNINFVLVPNLHLERSGILF